DEARRALGVEDVLRARAGGAAEDGEVLPRVVEHLDDGGVGEEGAERREVEGGGVEEVDVVLGEGELDDAEAGVVRPLPHELGVEGDGLGRAGAGDERGELLLRGDHSGAAVAGVRRLTTAPLGGLSPKATGGVQELRGAYRTRATPSAPLRGAPPPGEEFSASIT